VTPEGPELTAIAAAYDGAAARVLAAAREGYESGRGFAAGIGASLAGVLELLDRDRELARLLVLAPLASTVLAQRSRRWVDAYAGALRAVAAESGEVELPPSFVEPNIVLSLAAIVGRRLESPTESGLEGLLAESAEFVLAYYESPEQG